MCWDKSVDEIAYLTPKLKAFIGTPSEVRVVLGYVNRLGARIEESNADKINEMMRNKIKGYEYLIRKFPDTKEAEYATFVLGLIYIDFAEDALTTQNREKAIEFMNKIDDLYHTQIKKNPEGPYSKDMKLVLSRINTFLETN
jgi:outer membrane protein assembly factor BamD (BamD/ComL family)